MVKMFTEMVWFSPILQCIAPVHMSAGSLWIVLHCSVLIIKKFGMVWASVAMIVSGPIVFLYILGLQMATGWCCATAVNWWSLMFHTCMKLAYSVIVSIANILRRSKDSGLEFTMSLSYIVKSIRVFTLIYTANWIFFHIWVLITYILILECPCTGF